mmetsp:Transcript_94073/g.261320  ORF Transcript_94073/g.261320 Transcript_94073/m.261320 type:complete len:224 (+) Transcript_94073:215-886(+)
MQHVRERHGRRGRLPKREIAAAGEGAELRPVHGDRASPPGREPGPRAGHRRIARVRQAAGGRVVTADPRRHAAPHWQPRRRPLHGGREEQGQQRRLPAAVAAEAARAGERPARRARGARGARRRADGRGGRGSAGGSGALRDGAHGPRAPVAGGPLPAHGGVPGARQGPRHPRGQGGVGADVVAAPVPRHGGGGARGLQGGQAHPAGDADRSLDTGGFERTTR